MPYVSDSEYLCHQDNGVQRGVPRTAAHREYSRDHWDDAAGSMRSRLRGTVSDTLVAKGCAGCGLKLRVVCGVYQVFFVARIEDVEIRRAGPADVDAMALVHRDSIRSLGAEFYAPASIANWAEAVSTQLYLAAIDKGEVFFVASGVVDNTRTVVGFSSDYPMTGSTHGTSVYVRGSAARAGVGSALLRTAEEHARRTGAAAVEIEASLAGVEFYRSHGYVDLGRVQTRLTSGRFIECVLMRKELSSLV